MEDEMVFESEKYEQAGLNNAEAWLKPNIVSMRPGETIVYPGENGSVYSWTLLGEEYIDVAPATALAPASAMDDSWVWTGSGWVHRDAYPEAVPGTYTPLEPTTETLPQDECERIWNLVVMAARG